ncbi:hypothetical protein HMSSN036_02270 [Paenibacillus macerans]|nr:hypothetical protein HMSSN036_02270 [Paenibacillus macerans]
MKPALLIIDMQKGLLTDPRLQSELSVASEYINAVADLFRDTGRPVVVVQDTEMGEHSPGFEVTPEIRLADSDLRISKEWNNAFWKTDLEQLLRDKETDFVVVCGFAAEHCVTFTFNGARERGLGRRSCKRHSRRTSGCSVRRIPGPQFDQLCRYPCFVEQSMTMIIDTPVNL